MLFFQDIRDRYLKNIIIKEYYKNKNKTTYEETLYTILFKKLNLNKKIE